MALIANTRTTRIALQVGATRLETPNKEESEGFIGILRNVALFALAGVSFFLPETLPALIGLAATDFAISTTINVVSAQSNKTQRKNLGMNIAIDAIADIMPIASVAFKGARAIKRINLAIEDLQQTNLVSKLGEDIENITKGLNKSNAVKRQKLLGEKILRAGQDAKQLETVKGFQSAFNSLGYEARVSKKIGRKIAADVEENTDEYGLIKPKGMLLAAQADAEREAFQSLKEFGDLGLAGFQQSRRVEYLPELADNNAKAISSAARRSTFRNILAFQNTKRLYKNYGLSAFFKVNKFFSSRAGHTFTQNIQLLNPTDAGREAISKPLHWLKNKIMAKYKRSFDKLREKLETKFKLKTHLTKLRKAMEKNIIPVSSSWIFGARIIKQDALGTTNTLIVFFRNAKYRPRYIRNVPKWKVLQFFAAPSKGSFYKRNFALSSNGRDLFQELTWAKATLFSVFPLNGMRNIFSIYGNIRSTIKFAKAHKQNIFQAWLQTFSATVGRNLPTRLTRGFMEIITGGGGVFSQTAGKFGSAIAKSINLPAVSENAFKTMAGVKTPTGKPLATPHLQFNYKPLVNAVITTGKTHLIRQGKNRFAQDLRANQRWLKTAVRIRNFIK